jgi:hypothetical protein
MDYDVDAFREGVAEVDDLHHEGMRTMGSDVLELHAETRKALGGTSRRQFLVRSGLTAAAVTIGSVTLPMSSLFSPVFGQTLDDASIAAFAASVEYAAVKAYTVAAGTGKVTGPALDAAKIFLQHHQQHGDAFAGASGGKATKNPNTTLVNTLGPAITNAANQAAILTIAYGVENAAAATYLFALQALKDPGAQKLTASILPVEAGHAVVLGNALGYTPADDGTRSAALKLIPSFQTQDGFVDPSKTPA